MLLDWFPSFLLASKSGPLCLGETGQDSHSGIHILPDDAYGPTDSSLEEAFLCPFVSSGLWWDMCADTTCLCSSLNPYIAVIRAGSFPSLFEEMRLLVLLLGPFHEK